MSILIPWIILFVAALVNVVLLPRILAILCLLSLDICTLYALGVSAGHTSVLITLLLVIWRLLAFLSLRQLWPRIRLLGDLTPESSLTFTNVWKETVLPFPLAISFLILSRLEKKKKNFSLQLFSSNNFCGLRLENFRNEFLN